MKSRAVGPDRLCSDPIESAVEAGLRYVDAMDAGIRRLPRGRGFCYVGPDRHPVRDRQHLQRIRSLVIPPAWKNVWICPTRNGHIQAIGWDAKGRKQYRYHAMYREIRDRDKFSRMIAFGTVLAVIRRRVTKDLRRSGLPREKVLATVVRLLETTCVRIGNDEYAKENSSFGLTTLRNRHVQISGGTVRFRFTGKSGQNHSVELTDRSLARIVQQCQELPGYRLFQYVDEAGNPHTLDSGDINEYLRQITGQEFTAKDFRTWAGTVLAAREFAAAGTWTSESDKKRKIVAAVKQVAKQLGNRPATCRKYYIHPAIVEAYSQGSLLDAIERGVEQEQAYSGRGLRAEEYGVMVLIAGYLETMAKETNRVVRTKAA